MTRIVSLLLLLLAPGAAWAGCSITAVPLAFGAYRPVSGSRTDSTGSVTVLCAAFSGTYAIALNGGDPRQMSGPATLSYQLYTDAARNTVWGDGTGGTVTVFGSCAGSCTATYPVYGRIMAHQPRVRPGSYVHSIAVTLAY